MATYLRIWIVISVLPDMAFIFESTVLANSLSFANFYSISKRYKNTFPCILFVTVEICLHIEFRKISNGTFGYSSTNADLLIHVSSWWIIDQMEANGLHCLSTDTGHLCFVPVCIISNIHRAKHRYWFRRMSIYACRLYLFHRYNLYDAHCILPSTPNSIDFRRINIDLWSQWVWMIWMKPIEIDENFNSKFLFRV